MGKIRRFLQRADSLIGRIPLDFTLHFIVSAAIVWVFTVLFALCGCSMMQAIAGSMLTAMFFGIVKETVINIVIKGGVADDRDIAADACGAVSGALLIMTGALFW